ncbi:MAG: hypothetical protein ACRENL_03430 [Candidatus Dormibacteria bacterium]
MGRPLIIGTVAWCAAVIAAIAGAAMPGDQPRLSLGLLALAVALAAGAAILLVVDWLRRRSARRGARAAAQSLSRLEYLPAVTTRTRLLRWRGGRYLVGRSRLVAATPGLPENGGPRHAAQAELDSVLHLRGSAYPRPASSTTQPRTDAAPAAPRAP